MLAHIPQDHPAVTIWTQPRQTFRELIDQGPTQMIVVLAALHGLVTMIDRVSSRDAGDVLPLPAVFLLCLVIGPVTGILTLYIGAFIFRWTGRWLGGQGNSGDLRTGLAWAGLPVIASLPVWGLLALMIGPTLFTSASTIATLAPWQTIVVTLLGLVILALGLWSTVLIVLGIAEAHRFSIWRAVSTLVLPLVLLIAVFLLIVIAVALIA